MERVALACTGGGIKACVNIGVLRALEDLNIEIEALSGASMGSIIAFLYSCGYTPKEILEIFENDISKFEKMNLLEKICAFPRLLVKGGATYPKKVEKFFRNIVEKNNLNLMTEINKPLVIPSLDISNREIIYYCSKPLKTTTTCYYDREIIEALRSSCSLPLLYIPNKVVINGKNHFMLDGGIMTNTLVSPLKEYSDFIIGVTTKFYPEQREKINLLTGFTQTFQSMRRSHFVYEKELADLWLEFDLESNDFLGDVEKIRYCEQYGYELTMEKMKNYLATIKEG